MKKPKVIYSFYILRCKDSSLYCGITKNLQQREHLHNTGKGSAYVHSRGGGTIVYWEDYPSLQKAMRREREVKTWTRKQKLQLIIKK